MSLADLTRNWMLKIVALVLAVLLWSVTKAEEITRVPIPDVPVEIALDDPGWALAAPPVPDTVTVTFSGPVRELVRVAMARPRVVVPVEQVVDSAEFRQFRTTWVRLQGEFAQTRVDDIRPSSVRLRFDRIGTRLLPVAVRHGGEPATGFGVDGPLVAEPAAVRVSGPLPRLSALDSIPLVPIDIRRWADSQTVTVAVDTAGLGGLIVQPRNVDVLVPISPAPDNLPDPDSVAPPADGPPAPRP